MSEPDHVRRLKRVMRGREEKDDDDDDEEDDEPPKKKKQATTAKARRGFVQRDSYLMADTVFLQKIENRPEFSFFCDLANRLGKSIVTVITPDIINSIELTASDGRVIDALRNYIRIEAENRGDMGLVHPQSATSGGDEDEFPGRYRQTAVEEIKLTLRKWCEGATLINRAVALLSHNNILFRGVDDNTRKEIVRHFMTDSIMSTYFAKLIEVMVNYESKSTDDRRNRYFKDSEVAIAVLNRVIEDMRSLRWDSSRNKIVFTQQ